MPRVSIEESITLPVSGNLEVASENILEKYKFSDSATVTATDYYGYIDKDGNWYILQLTDSAARYCSGASDYTTNWGNRIILSYDYFDEIF